jgi:hypothetical protein
MRGAPLALRVLDMVQTDVYSRESVNGVEPCTPLSTPVVEMRSVPSALRMLEMVQCDFYNRDTARGAEPYPLFAPVASMCGVPPAPRALSDIEAALAIADQQDEERLRAWERTCALEPRTLSTREW